MLRRIFTLVSAVSLLLCAMSFVAWARSYQVQDRIIWARPLGYIYVTSSKGRLWVFCWVNKPGDHTILLLHQTLPPAEVDISRQRWVIRYVHVPGFTLRTGAAAVARALFDVTGSYWLAAVVTALLPARWFMLYRGKWRREAWLRAGGCIKCGYNLTGNASGVCPECGAPIESPSPASQ